MSKLGNLAEIILLHYTRSGSIPTYIIQYTVHILMENFTIMFSTYFIYFFFINISFFLYTFTSFESHNKTTYI